MIKEAQQKLLAAHEKTKSIARSADMMEIRETMQVRLFSKAARHGHLPLIC